MRNQTFYRRVQEIENKSTNWNIIVEAAKVYHSPLSNIVITGANKIKEDKDSLESELQDAIENELQKLEKYLPILATIGSLSTLLGFTGTVTGMITAFSNIVAQGVSTPLVVAGGIAEALITTAAGLFIAIPTVTAHSYFSHRVDQIIFKLERYTKEIFSLKYLCK